MKEKEEDRWYYSIPEPGQLVTFFNNVWGYDVVTASLDNPNGKFSTNSGGRFCRGDNALCVEIISLELFESSSMVKDFFDYEYCFKFLIEGEVIFVYEWDYQIAMGRTL